MQSIAPPGVHEPRLTPRQKECLRHVYERRTTKEISALTGLAAGTVDTYIAEAVTALNARNRRHAAELTHVRSCQTVTPGTFEPKKSGVEAGYAKPIAPDLREAQHLETVLPFRQKGAIGNDLGPLARLFTVFGFAIALAAGFGMLAIGMRVVSDVAVSLPGSLHQNTGGRFRP